ncbi:MAG: hypothetical protein ACREMJ_05195 [Gemmatimonadales bacterium]
MRRLLLVFAAAVALYLPTVRYDFVQDDRGIIVKNPAAQSLGAALRAFDDPYWPEPSQAGLYRPVTILSYAVDWSVSGGRPGWFHIVNALWHGLATVLVALVLGRWLPPVGATAAALVFAVHPVHVEGVASIVSRAELLAAVGMLGSVLAARRRQWVLAVACATAAMFSKEHGVATGVLILLDDWLQGREGRRYPIGFYLALGAVTAGFLGVWWHVGREATGDMAPAFRGVGAGGRLAVALPAVWRAAGLLLWPADLSADYNPQVIPVREGLSLAAVGGAVVVAGVPLLAVWCRRRAPAVALGACVATVAYLPTSNLLFASGVVLAERNLYLAVLLVAAAAGTGAVWAANRWGVRRAALAVGVIGLALAARSWLRLPVWESNKSLVLVTLTEHPEAYRARVWAAAVLAGMGDTAGARAQYAIAGELFDRDPYLDAARASYLMGLGDTSTAAPLIARARRAEPRDPFALRAHLLLLRSRGELAGARALADSALGWFPADAAFYRKFLQSLTPKLRPAR